MKLTVVALHSGPGRVMLLSPFRRNLVTNRSRAALTGSA